MVTLQNLTVVSGGMCNGEIMEKLLDNRKG